MRFRNLDRFRTGRSRRGGLLEVPLPKTRSGRVYRYSPNEDAHPRHFVLGHVQSGFSIIDTARARMKLEPRSNQSVCPYSGVVDDEHAFTHPKDIEAAFKKVKHAAFSDVENELRAMCDRFNRASSPGSLFRIQANVQTRGRRRPRFVRNDLLRLLVCDHCGRDYGVFAISLFCPDCGAPNIRLHFAREVQLVLKQVDLAEAQKPDSEELAYRLLGNAHEDVLTAIEATLKAVYYHGIMRRGLGGPPTKPVKNDFQNVDRAQERFNELALDPFDGLDAAALKALRLNIQKRHVIGHNLGIVDAKFAEHAANARVGETVHLVGEDIRRFSAISQQVIDRLDTWLGGGPSPAIGNETQIALTP